MDKYKGKYRNESARAQWWNYGWGASYFITICTRGREHFFGEVRNEEMDVAGIVRIVGTTDVLSLQRSAAQSMQPGQMRFQNPGRNTISTIVGGYKSAVSKNVRASRVMSSDFGWQSRFHDHIIRDAEEYQRISEYILNNPRNWDNDEFRR